MTRENNESVGSVSATPTADSPTQINKDESEQEFNARYRGEFTAPTPEQELEKGALAAIDRFDKRGMTGESLLVRTLLAELRRVRAERDAAIVRVAELEGVASPEAK
jgi:hypothetical protein